MKKSLSFIFLFTYTFLGTAQEKPIHQIHASMVYSFIKYIQWPEENGKNNFVVGVMGDNDVFNTLKQLYDGKPKGNKKYIIRKLISVTDVAECDVVYLSKNQSSQFDNIKNVIVGKPILTVTNGADLAEKGSCINIKVIDGKLKFEMNQHTLNNSKLKVSSKLVSMAILL